ncbi:alpha-amylase family protein [Sinomonas terrae]|uniref:Alpha-amylase family protein n=1 Tax=Sinomonas terrae TaxID=2908838 RepID=A0ABS9U0T6_9MICC|nr:alpha-amylase family protein [Sinomonas terrae]MCH6470243.1 alpha-amylase family protein [Sinomonas terrae]
MDLDWVRNCVWWHLYPLGFVGAPIRDRAQADADPGRAQGMSGWLDYAVELGASGLLLGPVFASQTHGYDTTDHFQIDPRLGDLKSFDRFIGAARGRGLRIMLDGVFNHVGRDHPFAVDVRTNGRKSRYAEFFDISWAGDVPEFATFEGHDSLVALNHRNPDVADYVADVMRFWLSKGIDAWRLDAAYTVDPRFWARVLPAVRAEYPETWFAAEVIHGDYGGIVRESGVDSVTQYELWKAIWSSILDRNFFELDWALDRHNGMLDTFVPQTFVGNHDVTRIASKVGTDGAVLALVVLMTAGGIPSIYAGDEQGFVGVKEDRVGGDDAIRPAFPTDPNGLADWGYWLMGIHQNLIGIRRRHPWLVTARTHVRELTNERYVYETVASDGSDSLRVELDLTDRARAAVHSREGGRLFAFP